MQLSIQCILEFGLTSVGEGEFKVFVILQSKLLTKFSRFTVEWLSVKDIPNADLRQFRVA